MSPEPEKGPNFRYQQLVAPIALYPDALVAQILAAATYPRGDRRGQRPGQPSSSATAVPGSQ